MTRLYSCTASGADTAAAIERLRLQFPPNAGAIRMAFAFYDCGHDDELLARALRESFPEAAIMGGSSAGGVASGQGFHGTPSIGLLLIEDEDGDYGVAAAPLGTDPAGAAQSALQQALANCDCSGQVPDLVWIYQAPGFEEAVIDGLQRVVGNRCPILGGSAADNDVSGHWRQLDTHGARSDGVVIGVLFPSTPLGFSFQCGYEPLGASGVVTSIDGQPPNVGAGMVTGISGREIATIDSEPAAAVYNRWTSGLIEPEATQGGVVFNKTTMHPIATCVGQIDGVPYYLLAHPESVSADGCLSTFRSFEVGARIYAMRGSLDRLITRAGSVVEQARKNLPDPDAVAGALVVYCGGCKMAVGDQIGAVASSVSQYLEQAPVITCFTYGEQGSLLGHNLHGNLMISAVVFSS